MSQNPPIACIWQPLHNGCDPRFCKASPVSECNPYYQRVQEPVELTLNIKSLEKSAKGGCTTCQVFSCSINDLGRWSANHEVELRCSTGRMTIVVRSNNNKLDTLDYF